MVKNGVNGNGNGNGNGNQRFCSVCCVQMGTYQKDVTSLPAGGFAHESCLLEIMNRVFIIPAKKVASISPVIGSPRETMSSILGELKNHRKTSGVPQLLKMAKTFSNKFGLGIMTTSL